MASDGTFVDRELDRSRAARGAENMVVDITPPPCLWIPQGDAHTGSQYVIDFYNNTDPGPGALFDGQHAFAEAKQLVVENPMPAGTWYCSTVSDFETVVSPPNGSNAVAKIV